MAEFSNIVPCRFVGESVCCTPFQRDFACGGCGFNPEVSAERLEKIKKKLKRAAKQSK